MSEAGEIESIASIISGSWPVGKPDVLMEPLGDGMWRETPMAEYIAKQLVEAGVHVHQPNTKSCKMHGIVNHLYDCDVLGWKSVTPRSRPMDKGNCECAACGHCRRNHTKNGNGCSSCACQVFL